jgi:hypothetical protein
VRFADDFVVGFQHRDEAERFLAELGRNRVAVALGGGAREALAVGRPG